MILVIDNFDSFTYNLVQYLAQLGADVVVKRNNEITLAEIDQLDPDGILLSPGPCSPKESGICRDISNAAISGHYAKRGVPLFGVCLGHQTLGDCGGGLVRQAKTMMHGKASKVEHDGKGLFAGMPNPFSAIRYHSLVIEESAMPKGFFVTARSLDDGEIQGIRHESLPIEGVQFHPESILTEVGMTIVENFLKSCRQITAAQ
ncbi:MAG: aminodeoxychorismate/anthranilate synthase component II [Fimbriimonadaceae bacterium]|nr:aminodeoxychorismate/anthranilate synthase component II [Fimbriimonadaceae bacterium]